MGSSMVTTTRASCWLRCSIMAARVVDLPLPAGPVTSTNPRCLSARLPDVGGDEPRRSLVEAHQGSIDAQDGWGAGPQVQVGGPPFDGQLQQLLDAHLRFSPSTNPESGRRRTGWSWRPPPGTARRRSGRAVRWP